MADIQQLLGELAGSRITPAVLGALDYVVPGEWTNVTSLDAAIASYLGVTDPAETARIRERALALWQQRPHYQRAVTVFQAVDTADVAIAAAVAASAVPSWNPFAKVTPKADTLQALDAALKLAAEVAAFALLRGVPVTSIAAAQAFPAALATYAKADMMRLAAWIAIDGLLPLGPDFVQKMMSIVQGVDASTLASNPLYGAVKGYLPGGTVEEQKGFLQSTMGAGASWVSEFVKARGLTQAGLAGSLASFVGAADKGFDVLAAALDASTSYYAHTGVQSVARALVHDAQESLAANEVVAAAAPPAPVAEGSSWFTKVAMGGAAAAAVAGVAGVAGATALWNAWNSDDDDDDKDDATPDPALAQLDDNALAAREAALEMQARQTMQGPQTPEQMQQMQQMMMQRKRIRRARRMRMMQMQQQGRGMRGMGPGMGGGMGGRGGMGRGGMGGRGMGGGGGRRGW